MGLVQDFNNLSLARQLQLTILTFIIVLSGIMIMITKLQLDWFENDVLSMSQNLLDSLELEQIRLLAKSEARFFSIEFKGYIKAIHNFRELSQMAIGGSQVTGVLLENGSALWVGECAENSYYYNSSCYGSTYGQASSGDYYTLVTNLSCLNPLLFALYQANFLNLFQGFELNGVLNSYPGMYYDYTSFTPIVREWYYTAYELPNTTSFTEPYQDTVTSDWVISISQAINSTKTEVSGVAGVDITLTYIQSKASNVGVLNGYEILVSDSGMILVQPDSWSFAESIRIYDESLTGFSETLWAQVNTSQPGDQFVFTDINGTEFYMIVDHVQLWENSSIVSYYVLIMIERIQMQKPVNSLYFKFNNMNTSLFWSVLAMILAVILFSFTLIYFAVRGVISQLQVIEKAFKNILRRALFPKPARDINQAKLDYYSAGIEDLVEGVKYKLKCLNRVEDDFSAYKWGATRPRDFNLYSLWLDSYFPFNKLHNKKFTWEAQIPKLITDKIRIFK